MAYLAQTFTAAQVLTAGQMNQVESNITAARTHDKGATAPPTLSAGLTWLEDDNPSATVWRWQMYDGTDWIALLDLDTTNNQIELPNVASINGHGMWGNRNLLINGNMQVADRGTAFTSATTPANSDDTYLLAASLYIHLNPDLYNAN